MRNSCCWTLLLAWVLWTRTQAPAADSWIAAPGFPNKEKCEASIKDKLDLWRAVKDAKFSKNSVTFTTNNSSMTYLCLPEAEDPRQKTKP